MKVPFFDYPSVYLKYRNQIDEAQNRVQSSGHFILGPELDKLEMEIASRLGVKFALGVNSGTDALFLALKAHGIGEGDEVITVSNTFKASVTTIMHTGATAVLVDIGDDYLMDVDKVMDACTHKTKAIMPVHLSGDMVNMRKLRSFAKEHSILIIEDAAQAMGASMAGFNAGNWGDIGCFSFYPAKILGATGDAGMIVTNDGNIYAELLEMRNHYKGAPGGLGYNSRLDNIHAATLLAKLPFLEGDIARREDVARMYDTALAEIPGIVLPVRREGRVYQDYIIRHERRDALAAFLAEKEIGTMIPPILPHQELAEDRRILTRSFLKKSEEYNAQFLRLPCNPYLTDEQVEYVIENIKLWSTESVPAV